MSGRQEHLPERLLTPLTRLHVALERGKVDRDALAAAVVAMNGTDPGAALAREALWPHPSLPHWVTHDDWLLYAWRHPESFAHKLLYNSRHLPRIRWLVRALSNHRQIRQAGGDRDLRLLAKHPDLALVFMRHPNGYLREAGLKALKVAAVSPFVLASLMYRLNDWVEPVRREAAKAIHRLLPAISAETIAAAAPALARYSIHWGRIKEHRGVLVDTLTRPDVVTRIVDNLKHRPAAGSTALLHILMTRPEIDVWLPELAREALTPAIRAAATQALISGMARWPAGRELRTVTAYSGDKRSVIVFSERPLTITVPAADILSSASQDRAASVRKLAADAIIAKQTPPELADALIHLLKNDPSNTVRSRIDFIVRRRSELA